MGSTKFVRFRLLRSAFRTTLLCPKLLEDQRLLARPRLSAGQRRSVIASRGSMQATNHDQTEKEIFVVVGNRGCHLPAPDLADWAVHAQAPRVEPFSGSKDQPGSTPG